MSSLVADKKKSSLIKKLESIEAWNEMLELSKSKLVIVDCYQDWCGHCESILPTLNRFLLDFDDVDDRLQLVAASVTKIGSTIQSSIAGVEHNTGVVDIENKGCIPVFALFKNRQCVSLVLGADAPSILQSVSSNIPDKVKKTDQE